MTDELMYNTKAGLMGALAGIGDSIDSGTIQYIFIAIAVPWAQSGSFMGARYRSYECGISFTKCHLKYAFVTSFFVNSSTPFIDVNSLFSILNFPPQLEIIIVIINKICIYARIRSGWLCIPFC